MSKSASILDEFGNINASFLQLELQEALSSDIKYKQVDNMKKRAVKVAADYNEFKAMVACAHLKKISSKEVASLSDAKKGWKKKAAVDGTTLVQILSKEQEFSELSKCEKKSILMKSNKYPKSCMELERDLRRMKTDQEKFEFLSAWTIKRAKAVLARGADTDIIEQIWSILATCQMDPASPDDAERGEPITDHTAEVSVTSAPSCSSAMSWGELVGWLGAITEFDNFRLALRFAPRHLTTQVLNSLQMAKSSAMLQSDAGTDIQAIIDLYQS